MNASTSSVRKLVPVSHELVRITKGFWEERLRTNRDTSIPIGYGHCKKTGRIDAFKLDWKKGDPNPPHVFWDSDVAKWVEAASLSVATNPDPALERKLKNVVDLIASAQQPDGYLNIHFTVVEPKKRWSNLRDLHELYCAGHLMEAAVAHHEATGSRTLLDVMCRYADYIDTVFGRGRGKKRGYPGHEEIELALVKLYRATGKKKYLDLAKYFVDERGRSPHYYDMESRSRGERPGKNYDEIQAHLPVRQQKTADGHAVRAGYLYAGMADVAAETGDKELLKACRTLWKNIIEKRMYVHGSIGSTRHGERFTIDYDLPNETAYAETCAAISLVFFAHRMLQIDPDRQYSDVMERALYNGVISGVSQTGDHFFYDNFLASKPGVHKFMGQKSPKRQEWFGCACCPTNIVRILASLGQYVYSQSKNSIYVHLYVNGEATIQMRGQQVKLVQNTNYPWSERVRIRVSPAAPAAFTLAVRIPGWCKKAQATVNGKRVAVKPNTRKGYLQLKRTWQKGDRVELVMDMPVERVEAHPSVRHDCGRIALQRGPVLYCLEGKDNGRDLNDLVLPRNSKLTVRKPSSGFFKGIPVITGKALSRDPGEWKGELYRTNRTRYRPCRLTAIPYFMWANRGEGEMLVWITSSLGTGK